jgi:hypothetical protein
MADFPEIRTGVVTQLPFVGEQNFANSVADMPSGLRYSYYYDASPRRRWELTFPALTTTELATLLAFYESVGGAWDAFTFTDPDVGTAYTKCRFSGDSFSYEQNGPTCSAKMIIEEFR